MLKLFSFDQVSIVENWWQNLNNEIRQKLVEMYSMESERQNTTETFVLYGKFIGENEEEPPKNSWYNEN